jgi:hypothetical protein
MLIKQTAIRFQMIFFYALFYIAINNDTTGIPYVYHRYTIGLHIITTMMKLNSINAFRQRRQRRQRLLLQLFVVAVYFAFLLSYCCATNSLMVTTTVEATNNTARVRLLRVGRKRNQLRLSSSSFLSSKEITESLPRFNATTSLDVTSEKEEEKEEEEEVEPIKIDMAVDVGSSKLDNNYDNATEDVVVDVDDTIDIPNDNNSSNVTTTATKPIRTGLRNKVSSPASTTATKPIRTGLRNKVSSPASTTQELVEFKNINEVIAVGEPLLSESTSSVPQSSAPPL